MNIKTTLHATAPLLYPCRRYPKCPWGLYASPPPVAMAVFGWFLCFPAFFWKNGFFSPIRDLRQKKSLRYLNQKKKISVEKKNATYAKKIYATYAKKNKKATYAYFHNRAMLSSRWEGLLFAPPCGDLCCPTDSTGTVFWPRRCLCPLLALASVPCRTAAQDQPLQRTSPNSFRT